MRKLKLDVDALTVDSFDATVPAPKQEGTVHGQQQNWTFRTGCCQGDGSSWPNHCFCTEMQSCNCA